MHIDEMLAMPESTKLNDSTWVYSGKSIPKDWAQGRTAYGGISAGIIYSAMQNHVDAHVLLRAYTTNFIGPLALETPFDVSVEVLRQGKNVVQILGKITQNEKLCVMAQGVFGQSRDSSVVVENDDNHSMVLPKKPNFIPQIPKVTPKFLRHFDLSIEDGGIPFTRKKTSHYHGWMRFKQPPKTYAIAHLISAIDSWPPTLLQMLKWPAPASTVSWHIDFLHPLPEMSGENWLGYQALTRQANDGYGHTEATVYDQYNQAIALSRQTVAVFDG